MPEAGISTALCGRGPVGVEHRFSGAGVQNGPRLAVEA